MNSFQSRISNRAFQGVRRVCDKCKGTCRNAETGAACSECGGVGFNTIKEKGSGMKRAILAVALLVIVAVSGCASKAACDCSGCGERCNCKPGACSACCACNGCPACSK